MKFPVVPAALLAVTPCHAGEVSPAPVDEILVTAFSRAPQPLSTVGASLSVLDVEDLKAGQYTSVAAALETLPGVAVTRTGAFGAATAAIRGASSDQTVTLIDGIEVNDVTTPGGGYNYAYLDSFDIARIEVLRGPQSLMYGSKAIGGVVSIVTAPPEPGFAAAGLAEAGAFNTFRAAGRIAGGSAALRGRLSLAGERSDGISSADAANGNPEQDGYENLSLKGGLYADPSDRWSLRLTFRHARGRADYDGYTPDFSAPADAAYHEKNRETQISGVSAYTFASGRGHWDVSFNRSAVRRDNFSDYPGSQKGWRQDARTLLRFDVNKFWSASAGGEVSRAKAKTLSPVAVTLSGFFGEVALHPTKDLTVTAGLRHDRNSRFGGATTARATAVYSIPGTGARLHASYGEGFKAPTVFQLTYICDFCSLDDPNPDLKPERAQGGEAGLDWTWDRFFAGVTAFRRTTRDLIAFDYLAGYANVASARAKGVEAEMRWNPSDWLELGGNYTYTDAADGDGVRLSRIPRHAADLFATFTPLKAFGITAAFHRNGMETDSYSPGVPAWARVDLKARYTINDSVEIYGRIKNLFDRHYQRVYGYGTPGASAYLGVRASY